jgi:hypothetical protein
MSHKTIRILSTVLPLLSNFGLQAACGSDSGGTPGTGGALGLGGSSGAGSGGTPGTDTLGVPVGTPRPCVVAETTIAPADGFIIDFSVSDAGNNVGSDLLAYPIRSPSAPTYTTSGGSLHVTVNTPATSVPQYLGVVVGPWKTTCVDASAFTGVQFSISGSFSGCTMKYLANDDAHQDEMSGAPRASGPAGSYAPTIVIAANQVTSTAQVLKMPFDRQSGGNPSTPIDQARIILLAWQFELDASASGTPTSCIADVTIDGVRFY